MTSAVVERCAALGDPMRWTILDRIGAQPCSASQLADELPISRQAIAKHLEVLEDVGLVTSTREGRSVRFAPLGHELSALATRLDAIGRGWDARLARLRDVAEGMAASPE